MNMTITASALRELHRIHRQVTDLKSRLARGPRLVNAAVANQNRCKQALDDAKKEIQQAKMVSDEKQLQLKQREDRILDLQAKLNTANSNKEYQTLKEQIAADKQANAVLSDEILEALDKIDQLQAAAEQVADEGKKADSEAETVKEQVATKERALSTELERVTAELRRAESELPGDFKTEYDRVAKVRGEEALAEVSEESCSGCFQMVTQQMLNELLLSRPVFCPGCGALLYLPEDRSIG